MALRLIICNKISHLCTPMYRFHEVQIEKWKSGKKILIKDLKNIHYI